MANLYLGSRKFVPAFYNTGSEPSPSPTPTPFVDSQYSTYGVVGQPTIEENIAKNFASDSFIFLPERFNPENNPWEIQLKVKTPNSISRRNLIFGSFRGYMSCGVGGELQSDHFGFGFSSSGNSWNIGWIWGTTTPELNTWYYIKLSFTGTQYKFELSTDGINWNLEGSINSSETIYSSVDERLQFGTQDCNSDYYTGEIDLSKCYIRIITNPELLTWWKPHTKDGLKYAKVDNHCEKDYKKDSKMWLMKKSFSYEPKNFYNKNNKNFNNGGGLNWGDEGEVSGFTESQYITLYSQSNYNYEYPWTWHFKIKTGNDITTRQKINGSVEYYDHHIPTIEINSWSGASRFCIHISSDGSNWDIANGVIGGEIVQTNTIYYINLGWTGTEYYLDVSLDGDTYNRYISINSTSTTYGHQGGDYMGLGTDNYASGSSIPFLGSIYLDDVYYVAKSIWSSTGDSVYTPYARNEINQDWMIGRPIIDIPNNSYGIVRLCV